MSNLMSFIICTDSYYQEAELVSVLISSQQQSIADLEVICLCDNDRLAELKNIAADFTVPVNIILTDGKNANQGKNLALKQAQGEYIVILERGYFPQPDCCKRIIEIFRNNPTIGMIYSSTDIIGSDPSDPNRTFTCLRETPGPLIKANILYRPFFPAHTAFKKSLLRPEITFSDRMNDANRIFFNSLFIEAREQAFYHSRPLFKKYVTQLDLINDVQSSNHLSLVDSVRNCPGLYSPELYQGYETFQQLFKDSMSKPLLIYIPQPKIGADNLIGEASWRYIQCIYDIWDFIILQVPISDPEQMIDGLVNGMFYSRFYTQNIDDTLNRICSFGKKIVLIAEENPALLMASKTRHQVIVRILCTANPFTYEDFDQIDLVIKASEYTPVQLNNTACLDTSIRELTGDPAVQSALAQLFYEKESERDTNLKALALKLKTAKQYLRNYKAPNQDELSLSVIIGCRNVQLECLERCVASLRQQDHVSAIDIILSDYGSDNLHREELKALADRYQAKHVYTPSTNCWSRSIALNIGIQSATKKWVLTTDADMLFSRGFISMLSAYLKAFGEKCVFYAQPLKLLPVRLPKDWNNSLYDQYAQRSWLFDKIGKGGCQVATRELLMKVRGFNEIYSVWGQEDHDMYERLGWAGLERVWIEPCWYLHQWHLSNINYAAANNANTEAYLELKKIPKVIVNRPFWGKSSPAAFMKAQNSHTSFASTGLNKNDLERDILENDFDPVMQKQILTGIVRTLIELEQYGSALQTLEDICQLDSRDYEAFTLRAQITSMLGDHCFARILIDQALEANSYHQQALDLSNMLIQRYGL
ncbi:MAG: glycosyltransferase [Deltaproteobacteria bacterium]|nr:glycosyltransferase [Deltaproteobacteria bacterium]